MNSKWKNTKSHIEEVERFIRTWSDHYRDLFQNSKKKIESFTNRMMCRSCMSVIFKEIRFAKFMNLKSLPSRKAIIFIHSAILSTKSIKTSKTWNYLSVAHTSILLKSFKGQLILNNYFGRKVFKKKNLPYQAMIVTSSSEPFASTNYYRFRQKFTYNKLHIKEYFHTILFKLCTHILHNGSHKKPFFH